MSSESDLTALIAAVYEAGMDFSLWPQTLARIADAFGVSSASVARQGRTLSECWGFSVGIDPAMTDNYLEYYHSVNPIWQIAHSTPAGTVQTDSMVMPRGDLVRTEFFNDFLLPQQIEGLLNAVVLVEEGRQSVVTLHGRRQFDEHHVALYGLLAPHLRRAVQINVKLARTEFLQVASVAALSRLDEGVLFVSRDATVVFANKAAEKFFSTQDLRQSKAACTATRPPKPPSFMLPLRNARNQDSGMGPAGWFRSVARPDDRRSRCSSHRCHSRPRTSSSRHSRWRLFS
jgi:hypothetical protein